MERDNISGTIENYPPMQGMTKAGKAKPAITKNASFLSKGDEQVTPNKG